MLWAWRGDDVGCFYSVNFSDENKIVMQSGAYVGEIILFLLFSSSLLSIFQEWNCLKPAKIIEKFPFIKTLTSFLHSPTHHHHNSNTHINHSPVPRFPLHRCRRYKFFSHFLLHHIASLLWCVTLKEEKGKKFLFKARKMMMTSLFLIIIIWRIVLEIYYMKYFSAQQPQRRKKNKIQLRCRNNRQRRK